MEAKIEFSAIFEKIFKNIQCGSNNERKHQAVIIRSLQTYELKGIFLLLRLKLTFFLLWIFTIWVLHEKTITSSFLSGPYSEKQLFASVFTRRLQAVKILLIPQEKIPLVHTHVLKESLTGHSSYTLIFF